MARPGFRPIATGHGGAVNVRRRWLPRRGIRIAFAAAVLAVTACEDKGESAVPAEERIERTASALESFLTSGAALDEARRLVSMCETRPADMFYEQNRYWDPHGPEIFATLEDAERHTVGGTFVLVAELACDEAGLRYVHELGNV